MEPAPVKRKRRFEWTPARRAAFEKCRKAREAKLAASRSGGKKSSGSSTKEALSVEEAREQARRVLEVLRKQGSVKSKSPEHETEAKSAGTRTAAADESAVVDQVLRNLDEKVAALVQVHLATSSPPKQKKVKPQKPKQRGRKMKKVKIEEPDESDDDASELDETDLDMDAEEEEVVDESDHDEEMDLAPRKSKKRASTSTKSRRPKPAPKRNRKPAPRRGADDFSDGEGYEEDVDVYKPNRLGASSSHHYMQHSTPLQPPQPMFRFL